MTPAKETAVAAAPNTAQEVDVIVLGMGPGGESVAGELAAAGLSVVGVEARLVGGECPYYGCIPSKMMIRAGNALAEALRIPNLAGSVEVTPDFSQVAQRIRNEATDNWDDTTAAKRFTNKGGTLVRGIGKLTGPREVTVTLNGTDSMHDGGQPTFRARLAVVLNPGTNPAVPPVPGLDGTPFWTNRDAVQAESAPTSLTVLGGGPIGVELAQAFNRFGTNVTIVLRGSELLSHDEPEAGQLLARVFREEGIKILRNRTVTAVAHSAGKFSVEMTSPTGAVSRRSSTELLVATGRTPALAGLDLAAAGINWDGKAAPTLDGHLQLSDGLYLLGDAAGLGAYTHMSMQEGNIVTGHILSKHNQVPDRGVLATHAVPHVTFTDPEIGAVGLTEQQARAAGLSIRVGLTELSDSTRGWIHQSGNEGFIKVIEDTASGVLVGATSMGPAGGEVLSALALAVHARIPVDTLKSMIYAYPTFHRAISSALAALE